MLPYVSDVSTIAMRIMVPAALEAAKKLSQHTTAMGLSMYMALGSGKPAEDMADGGRLFFQAILSFQ